MLLGFNKDKVEKLGAELLEKEVIFKSDLETTISYYLNHYVTTS